MERIPVILNQNSDNDDSDNDDIILEVDEKGIERMMFQMPWTDGHKMFCHCPMHGEWKYFTRDTFTILQKIGVTGQGLDIPELVKNPDKDVESWVIFKKTFTDFYTLSAEIMHSKINLAEDIENVFWKYMRPEVDGVEDTRAWFNKNAPVTSSVRFLTGLLNVENILKKNAELILKTTHPQWTTQPSGTGSKNQKDGQTEKLPPVQKSGYA